MLCNNLIVPILLKIPSGRFSQLPDFTGFLLTIRRTSIIFVVLLGYLYFHLIGEYYTLVSIGLISFTAVAQFAPAIIGGLFWKGGNRNGALAGLGVGFFIWLYTLVLPSIAQAGLIPQSFISDGPFGIGLLKPFELFGLNIGITASDPIANAVFWSILANIAAYVGVSFYSRSSAMEHTQAALFVDVFRFSRQGGDSPFWRGTASIPDLRALLGRCLGEERADYALFAYAQKRNLNWDKSVKADAGLVEFAEKLLAGAIGSASARVMVSSVVKEEPLGIEEVMGILDETRQVIAYSQELEIATAELRLANERLKELDSLKDEFISTVTHELRTPLTAVRSIAEIIHDSPTLGAARRVEFAGIIIKESERLTRLINQVLDFQKLESGRMEWQMAKVDFTSVVRQAITGINQLIQNKRIQINLDLPKNVPIIDGDQDRLVQVMINLVANAVNFCPPDSGRIDISIKARPENIQIDVKDNGPGITSEEQQIVFERFRQVAFTGEGRPSGSGLGLSITKHIIEHHGGKIWVNSEPDEGTTFSFTLPTST
jgi:signal transduction histidine kinase